jgi:branched-chain amino acid transport system substrate-binding protein
VARFAELRYGAMAVVGVAAMILVSGCEVVAGDDDAQTVLIGADLELTGNGSQLGSIYHDALQLRIEQVNQQGLLGDRRLELEVTDNRSDAGTAATNVAELAADPDISAIILGACGQCAVAAVEIANDRSVPMIALAAPDAVSEPVEERRYMFKLGPNANDNAALLASELSEAGAQTIALATVEDEYGEDGRREMQDAADGAGLRIVMEERLVPGEDSLRGAADRIAAYVPEGSDAQESQVGLPQQQGAAEQSLGPDAVVVWAFDPLAGQFAEALQAAGYSGGLYLDAAAAANPFLTGTVGEALANATMVFTETLVIDELIATSPAKAARQTWFRDYTARYGTYHAYSSFAADAVQLIVDAINRADSAGRDTLRDAIEGARLDGFTGPIRMAPQNHSGLRSQALTPLVVRGDRWRLSR